MGTSGSLKASSLQHAIAKKLKKKRSRRRKCGGRNKKV